MTALSGTRAVDRFGVGTVPESTGGIVTTAKTIYRGALCARDIAAGTIEPVSADPTLRVEGVADDPAIPVAGLLGDGTKTVTLSRGCYWFKNSTSTNAIALTEVDTVCYALDDQTVSKTNVLGTLPVAGIVRDYDSTKGLVAVEVGVASGGSAIQTITSVVDHADTDLAVAATSATRNLSGLLPIGALIHGYDIDVTEVFNSAGTGTFELEVGNGTTSDLYVNDAGNIDSAVARTHGAVMARVATSSRIVATYKGSNNLDTATAGTATLYLFVSTP